MGDWEPDAATARAVSVVQEVRSIRLAPGEILAVIVPQGTDPEAMAQISQVFVDVGLGGRVVVVDDVIQLAAVRPESL